MFRAVGSRKLLQRTAVGFQRSNITVSRFIPKNSFALAAVVNQESTSLSWNSRISNVWFSSSESNSEVEFAFQAETEKLLDIVTHSIYTDKDVFLRELISNASDALEKLRYQSLLSSTDETSEKIRYPERELAIRIKTNEAGNELIVEDSGIGMTKEEMKDNLGTIAKSGSKKFLQNMKQETDAKNNIIGQFGVGFYSAFMVGKEVEVYSRSALENNPDEVYKWTSSGTGKFKLENLNINDEKYRDLNLKDLRGTKIVIKLKDDAKDFTKAMNVRDVIKQRSKFVAFPIYVNEEKVNTVSALWMKKPNTVTPEEYKDFYKYSTNNFDEPLYSIHFQADVPLDIKCLLFIPSFNIEKLATGQRLEPGVSLYSRKILIENNSDKILPPWLRFLRGVVDSEDLPISLSRESIQNSRLLANINEVLVKRVIRFLRQESEKNTDAYIKKFYANYDNFIKEGVCTDPKHIDDLAKLLRFNSSVIDKKELASLDEYVSRCKPDQDKIYYNICPNYELGKSSPYMEVFDSNGIEVLFLYSPIDEFAVTNIGKFNERKLVSINSGLDMKLQTKQKEETSKEGENSSKQGLNHEERGLLKGWLKGALENVVSEIRISDRLSGSPALVVDHESVSTRRLMKQIRQTGENFELDKQILEINPEHEIIIKIDQLRKDPATEHVAKLLSRQVFDNALIAAGLIDDPREMLPRLNQLISSLLKSK